MTYEEWLKDHTIKMDEILKKLDNKSIEEIVEYFDYDNMVKKEPDFCPLYKDNIKCHDISKLNCYYCACPYFIVNKTPKTKGKTTIASHCSIDSRFSGTYHENPDANNVVKVHCDCSNCIIPHKKQFALRRLSSEYVNYIDIKNSNSFLEYIRYQQMKLLPGDKN